MSTTASAPPRLVRALGPLMATAVVVGTVIGSGVFKKPQEVAQHVPYFGLAALAWVLGGILALLGSLAIAEVAVLYPRAGGNYVFLREGYGRLAGFLWGWVEFWIIKGASLAALATVFAESLHDVLQNPALVQTLGIASGGVRLGFWEQRALTVAVIFGLAVVNVLGVRWSGWLQLGITLVKVGSLLGIMALPFIAAVLAAPGAAVPAPRAENLRPVWPAWSALDLGAFGAALVGVLWAYHGWMNIAPVAEEVRQPQRNIPLGLLGGVGVIIFLYLGANLAYALIIPAREMKELTDTTVATDFSARLLGPIGSAAASAAVMCSVFGALNGLLLAGPRVLYAMGEDGLAPRALGAIHPRFRTPAWAIIVLALWAGLLVVAAAAMTRYRLPALAVGNWALDLNVPEGKPLFDILTAFVMFGVVIFETLGVATVFIFRRRLPHAERPYRCWGYPVTPAVYVVILGLVAANMFVHERAEALAGVGFIAVGAVVYVAARGGRRK
ncbi:MAG TPA: amino acid permease [Gemmataceae bacterium]|jgi:amino acid transporter|nr:amino acid permease [Gemmataceae bacterium]